MELCFQFVDVFSSMYKLFKKGNGNIEKIARLVQLNDKRDEIEKQINDLQLTPVNSNTG